MPATTPTETVLTTRLLPIAKRLILESSAGSGLRGSDYGDFARTEAESLAYCMATAALARMEDLEASTP